MGGVDKLHEEGFTGEGIFIGVVDTGVDYLHPALGGCFGPGCKVVTGTDLVGDAYTGVETPVPDDDPSKLPYYLFVIPDNKSTSSSSTIYHSESVLETTRTVLICCQSTAKDMVPTSPVLLLPDLIASTLLVLRRMQR